MKHKMYLVKLQVMKRDASGKASFELRSYWEFAPSMSELVIRLENCRYPLIGVELVPEKHYQEMMNDKSFLNLNLSDL